MVCKRAGELSVEFVNVDLWNEKIIDKSGESSLDILNGDWQSIGENFITTDERLDDESIIYLNFFLMGNVLQKMRNFLGDDWVSI